MKKDYMTDDGADCIRFTDFPLAVTMMCLEYKLIAIEPEKGNSRRVHFIFEKSEAIEKLVLAYWNGNLLVDPKKFWNVSREIKSRIQSYK